MSMRVTIKDVAREAGVAISTVSKVLNGADNLRPGTRHAVEAAIRGLNYIPNANARSLKSRRKDAIGLFLSSIQGEFYTGMAQAIHTECMVAGFTLEIYVSGGTGSDEVSARILSSGVAGAVVFNEALESSAIPRVTAGDTPLVMIDREYAGTNASSVVIDSYAGVTQAIGYLIHQGHHRIGCMRGLPGRDDEERFRAFRDVMEKNNLPVREEWLPRGFFEEALAYGEIRKLTLQGIPLPEAFFCANDQMAWGCITALKEAGLSVPGQISVIGFDDVREAAWYTPALTTVRSPADELGRRSLLELLRLIRGKDKGLKGTVTKLEPALIVRDSCRLRVGK